MPAANGRTLTQLAGVFNMLWFLAIATCMALQAQAQPSGAKPAENADSIKKAQETVRKTNQEWAAKTSFTSLTIRAEGGGFGYALLANNQLYLWQPTIPGRPGNKGFDTQRQAEQCSRLALQKIREGHLPPTITEDDLKKIK